MALTRGHMGLRPCPKCLISRKSLADGTAVLEMRASQATKKVLGKARELAAKYIDDFLQDYGLRNVDVRFRCLVLRERLLITLIPFFTSELLFRDRQYRYLSCLKL